MTKQTLTQSQMPKAPDYAAFIASKVPGDEVLKKLNVSSIILLTNYQLRLNYLVPYGAIKGNAELMAS